MCSTVRCSGKSGFLAKLLLRLTCPSLHAFSLDWFIKSRSALEIQRRCTTLVQLVVKELDPDDLDELTRKRAPNKNPRKTATDQDDENDDLDSEPAGPKTNGVNGVANGKGKVRGIPQSIFFG